MIDADAQALLAIADRLERFSFQSSRDPERPFVERGEFVREIREVVYTARRRLPPVKREPIAIGAICLPRNVVVELRRPGRR